MLNNNSTSPWDEIWKKGSSEGAGERKFLPDIQLISTSWINSDPDL